MRIWCGPAGNTITGDGAELEFMQCHLCFTGGFRLKPHLKQGAGAVHTLGGQPRRIESCDVTRCVINAAAVKEGGSAACLQEVTFAHV